MSSTYWSIRLPVDQYYLSRGSSQNFAASPRRVGRGLSRMDNSATTRRSGDLFFSSPVGWVYHVTKHCAARSARDASGHAFDAWLLRIQKLWLRISAYHFYPFRSGILLIFSHGMLLQMISIMLCVTLFLGVTCDYMWSISTQ